MVSSAGSDRRRRRAEPVMRVVRHRVPDIRSAAFVEEARRQSALAAQGPCADDDQAFVDAISEFRT